MRSCSEEHGEGGTARRARAVAQPSTGHAHKAALEQAWAERLRLGQAEAWRAFENAVRPELLRRAEHLLGGSDVAQDVVQDVCLSVLRQKPGWCRSSVLGWCVHRLRTRARNWRRSDRRRSRREHESRTDPLHFLKTPAEEFESAAQRAHLKVAMSRLSSRRRRALKLRYIEDKPIKEVAREMGVSPKTVENTLRAARTELRGSFADLVGEALGDSGAQRAL
jgi:RNA polymerase sigma factor (sigma-70 family)